MSPTLARILAPAVLATRLIWFALTSSIPVYLVVARFVVPQSPAAIPAPALLATIVTLSLGVAITALLLPRVYPSDALLTQLMARDQSPEAIAETLAPARIDAELLGQLDAIERRMIMLVPAFRTLAILRAALAESIGVIGLVLGLLSGSFMYAVPFAALALVILLLAFPRIEPLVERARPLVHP